jgi:acyl-CoA synthetase (NDP forming)
MTASGAPAASPAPAIAAHRLAKLLAPRSIALIGASQTPHTVGSGMIRSTAKLSQGHRVYPVNPKYTEIDGMPCYPSIAELPEVVDHVVLGIANARIEAQIAEAIRCGVGAATIFGSCYLESDSLEQDGGPPLTRRISAMAKQAGMALCGGNGMGFYNLDHDLRVCGFPPPEWLERGGVTFISHSGSAFTALVHNDRRFRFNLAVSSGQELVTNAADYLDYALDQPTTRAVGLFLETVRDPQAFVAALEKAAERDIPVVALKVGRTAESAALAVSHSGAIAGDHGAYAAVFDRYGVIQVDDLDELGNALLLMENPRRVAKGGLASMHDSGGLRELLVDLASEQGVKFARINADTTAKLASRLDYGLDPINPLDAWGTGHDYEAIFTDCLTALAEDPDTAVAGMFVEPRDGYYLSDGYGRLLLAVAERSAKPIILTTNMASNGADELCRRLVRAGVPVLLGAAPTLRVLRLAFARRDWQALAPMQPPAVPLELRAKWAPRLKTGATLDEAEGLTLFADYGVPVLPHRIVDNGVAAVAAARALGFPVALKTAMPGILHKSDVGGVKLGLADVGAVVAAWDDLAARLGPRAIVMPMVNIGAGKGVELAFGAIDDPQFGPIVLAGAGGILIELLKDREFALPPFDAAWARRLVDRLKMRPLLDGKRGAAPADIDAVAEALARFSAMIADLRGLLAEVDVNPLVAGPEGCVALDALVVPKQGGQ